MKTCLKLIKSKIFVYIRNVKANDIINNLPRDKEESENTIQNLHLKMKKNMVNNNYYLYNLKRSNTKEDSLSIDKIHHIHRENQRIERNNGLYQYPTNFLKQVKYNPWEYLKDNSSSNSLNKNILYKDRYDYVDCDIDYKNYVDEFNKRNKNHLDNDNKRLKINKSIQDKDRENILTFKENEYNNYTLGVKENNIKMNVDNKYSINKFKILNMHGNLSNNGNINANNVNNDNIHHGVYHNKSNFNNDEIRNNSIGKNQNKNKNEYFVNNVANYNSNFEDIIKISNNSKKRQKVRLLT